VEVFLQAADRLTREFPQVRFIWAGKDTTTAPGGRTWAQHCTASFSHLNNVSFVDSCSDKQLGRLYAESSIYLCTSHYESFGLTLVEAMHAALPVVAPNQSGTAEVVRHGSTGYLYQPGDMEDLVGSVRTLLRSPQHSAKLGRNGQVLAATEYSPETMTERVLEVYRAVC
jgi:glycosyltransferase involved in cell wall biosynthesis